MPLQATLDHLGGGRFGQVVGAGIEVFLKTRDRNPPVREQMLGQNTDGVPAGIAKPAGDDFGGFQIRLSIPIVGAVGVDGVAGIDRTAGLITADLGWA